MDTDIRISAGPLDVAYCTQWVMTPGSGGIDMFIGTVRQATKGKEVVRLEFEAYDRMALTEMQKIADDIIARFPVHKVLIHHRTGILQVGEIPVIIAVSAAHRDAAFEACRYAIDTLKQTVPIWKKEIFADGATWVAAHP
jgi:molybdopterin synthase catalytic subunit